jgi:hypothetical protein
MESTVLEECRVGVRVGVVGVDLDDPISEPVDGDIVDRRHVAYARDGVAFLRGRGDRLGKGERRDADEGEDDERRNRAH